MNTETQATAGTGLVEPDDVVLLSRTTTQTTGTAGRTPTPVTENARLVRAGKATILTLLPAGDFSGNVIVTMHADPDTAGVYMLNEVENLRRDGFRVVGAVEVVARHRAEM
jgi:hypothetical protein